MSSLLYQVAEAALAAVVPPHRLAPRGFVRSPNAAGLPQALRKLGNAQESAPRPAH